MERILTSLGRPLEQGALELLHAEAVVILMVYESSPDNIEAQNSRLQEKFACQFMEIDGLPPNS